jgi:hypothetical protein
MTFEIATLAVAMPAMLATTDNGSAIVEEGLNWNTQLRHFEKDEAEFKSCGAALGHYTAFGASRICAAVEAGSHLGKVVH